jgi:NifU-like protein involved in Fe-S cluster formation
MWEILNLLQSLCSNLGAEALRKAIEDYENRETEIEK